MATSSDVVAVSAYGYGTDVTSVSWSGLSAAGSSIAPGTSYEPEPEPLISTDPVRCVGVRKDGAPCQGFTSGDDGMCAGHRRQRRALEGS